MIKKTIVFVLVLITLFTLFIPTTFASEANDPCSVFTPGSCTPNGAGQTMTCVVSSTGGGAPGSGTCQVDAMYYRAQTAADNYIAGRGCGDGSDPVMKLTTCTFWTREIGGTGGNPALAGAGGNIGAAAQALGAIAQLYYNKPASTYTALADMKKNMGLPVKSAYAQTTGFGFDALNPILPIWKVMRNVALAGFVIIFVVIGFMIMLRKNIDPRTVVTVQQSIPRIVIALLLVVFSYALCGILIDGMILVTRTGLIVLQANGLIAKGNTAGGGGPDGTLPLGETENVNKLMNLNIFELFDNLYNMDSLIDSLSSLNRPTAAGSGGFDTIALVLNIPIAGDSLLKTVLWIAIFIAMLRTFMMLLVSYLSITLNIIFSPFRFLMSAIPGSQTTFTSWIQSMLRHMLVFPTVFFMLAFAAIFNARAQSTLWQNNLGEVVGGSLHRNYWNVGPANGGNPNGVFPADSSFWTAPAMGHWGAAIGPLLSLGILLTIPKASEMVGEAVNSRFKPGRSEGAAGAGIKEAAGKIPLLRSYM